MERKQKILVGLSAVLLVAACILFAPVATPFLFAATLSMGLVPLTASVEQKLWPKGATSLQRTVFALVVTVLSMGLAVVTLALVVFVVVRNVDVLEDFGLQVAAKIGEAAHDLTGAPLDLRERAGDSLEQLVGYVQRTLFAVAGVAVDLIIFVSTLYLFLRYGREIRAAFRAVIPEPHRDLFDHFTQVTHSSLFAIYVVHGATAVITLILALPFFWLIGYGDNLLFWSLLCGAFQLVPVLGPSLIMAAIGIYAFAKGDGTTGILVFAIGYPLVAAVPDLVFRPLLMRTEMKLNALILIVGFFAGIASMGIIGFVMGPLMLKLLVESMKLTRDELKG